MPDETRLALFEYGAYNIEITVNPRGVFRAYLVSDLQEDQLVRSR